jgi:hypothetical protein
MLHVRIISIVWFLFGTAGTCWSLFDLYRNVGEHPFASVIEGDFIALAFSVTAAFAGYGAFYRCRWARFVCGVVSVVFLLYALSYVLVIGTEYGVVWFTDLLIGVLFSVYSLFVTVRYRVA